MRCEESTTLTPCLATISMSPWRNSRRASGSRLATGSSSRRSSGRFANGQGQRELCPLASRERSRLLAWVEAELIDPALGELLVPVRVEVRAHAEVLGDR